MNYIVSFPGLGIENLDINPVAFRLFDFPVYWYGLLIALAVLLSMSLALRHCKQFDLKQDDVLDALLLAVPLAIVFARLYYVVFEWAIFKDNLLKIFDTRSGGLAFYGGVLGGILGVVIIAHFKKIRLHRLADFLIVYIPLGQAIGRWGNFFNQEAFGTNTKLPWGMISNRTRSYLAALGQTGINPDAPVHPTFLYEFIANLIIFFVLLRIRKQSKQKYETLVWYLVLYGTVRFFVESIRTDALFIGKSNIRASMLLSAAMVIVGLGFLAYHWFRERRTAGLAAEISEDEEGVEKSDFSDITDEITTELAGRAEIDLALTDDGHAPDEEPLNNKPEDAAHSVESATEDSNKRDKIT